ncbi:hypothetical protein F5B20DRAFT_540606 [Whalleya microplaca]|nr:hypothetical protein F5B20DRAFT_540606 [Whalleya microplaca]
MAPPELLTLLRLLPIATTSCSLWFSLDQRLFLSIFVEPQNHVHTTPFISSYFRTMFRRAALPSNQLIT